MAHRPRLHCGLWLLLLIAWAFVLTSMFSLTTGNSGVDIVHDIIVDIGKNKATLKLGTMFYCVQEGRKPIICSKKPAPFNFARVIGQFLSIIAFHN